MSPVLRAGLVGLGVMGRNHARILASLDGVELVAVADPQGDAREVLRGVPVVDDVTELLELGIDYAVVAAPTSYHRAVGTALAAAGVHALIEKPLASSYAEAVELADLFAAAGLVGAVGHIERYNPALMAARARIAAGDLGAIYQVVTRRQSPFPLRIADVGVVLDLATHDIDLTRWVTGSSFVSVAAQTANRSGREHEDLVAIVGSLEHGVVSSHLVNWLTPVKERTVSVTGERGTFVIDLLAADLTFCENGKVDSQWSDMARFRGVSEGDVVRYAIAKPEPLRTEHEQFRDAVLGLPADIVTMADGAQVVQVAEAVLASAAAGRTVVFD
ncbi:MAG: UDP-N-acetylglucosamine 3-dehydrogenase [Actinomycetota bacterium]|nr:UDP-N-acetylglucosamine 3-dehydrogenase [Actinomycetota bacterium]